MNTEADDEKQQKDIDPDEIKSIFSSFEEKASRIQSLFIEGAEQIGYTKDAVSSAKDYYTTLANHQKEFPEIRPLLYSGSSVIDSVGKELDDIENRIKPIIPGLNNVASSIDVFYNATNTTSSTIIVKDIVISLPEEPPFHKQEQQQYIEKINKIDTALSRTYQEISQVLYATNSDPKRAASSMMRQAFDHLFEKIAPDNDVRNSVYWTQKKGPKPDQVTRRERMTFAANTRILDKSHAVTIINLFDNILDTYQLLNKFHKRGTLSDKQAISALRTMQKFIETWIDAINI
jgi:hypothetical protein